MNSIRIGDTRARNQALDAAASCALNISEAAGRTHERDKARVLGIAHGEVVECIGAVEVAEAMGTCSAEDVARVIELGGRVSAMLSRLA